MADTPRETILAELLRVASKVCTGPHPTLACFHNMTPRHLWCNSCRCQEAANLITRLVAECDTLRTQLVAAREGEIAALTIQSEQAEAEVLRHHGREDRLKEEAALVASRLGTATR